MLNATDLVEYKIVTQYDENDLEHKQRIWPGLRVKSRKRGNCRLIVSLLFIVILVAICVVALIPITASAGASNKQSSNYGIHEAPSIKNKHSHTYSDKELNRSGNNSLGDVEFGKFMKRIFPGIYKPGYNSTEEKIATNSSVESISTAKQVTPDNSKFSLSSNFTTKETINNSSTSNSTAKKLTNSTSKLIEETNKSYMKGPARNVIDTHVTTSHAIQSTNNTPILTTTSSIGAQSKNNTYSASSHNSGNTRTSATPVNSVSKLSHNVVLTKSSDENVLKLNPNQLYYHNNLYHDNNPAKKINGEDLEEYIRKKVVWIMCATILCIVSIFACLLLCFVGSRKTSYGFGNRSEELARLQGSDKEELLGSNLIY